MTYLLGTIILVTVVSRRIARGTQPQTNVKPRPAVRVALKAWAGYLIAVWCGFFIWGAVETIKGKLEWQRALPAGAFLLAFHRAVRTLALHRHKTTESCRIIQNANASDYCAE